MFHPENSESEVAGVADNLAEWPESDIPVETEDSSSVVISYQFPTDRTNLLQRIKCRRGNFELKYFLIF